MTDDSESWVAKKFEDMELETLLDKDCCQIQEELEEYMSVTPAAISQHLKAAG